MPSTIIEPSSRHSSRIRRKQDVADDIYEQSASEDGSVVPVESDDDDDDEEEDDFDEDAPWEAEVADDEDEDKPETDTRLLCAFCHQDEDHDPAEEYEEPIECALCGQFAHRQCARTSKLEAQGSADVEKVDVSDEDFAHWKCNACADIPVESEDAEGEVDEQDMEKDASSSDSDDADADADADAAGDVEVADADVDMEVDSDPGRNADPAVEVEVDADAEVGSETVKDPERGAKESDRKEALSGLDGSTAEPDEGGEEAGALLPNRRSRSLKLTAEPAARPNPPRRPSKRSSRRETSKDGQESAEETEGLPNPKRRKTSTSKRDSGRRAQPTRSPSDLPRVTKRLKGGRLLITFRGLDLSKLRSDESSKRKKRPPRPVESDQPPATPLKASSQPVPSAVGAVQPIASLRKVEETESSPYGGMLVDRDADTTRTYPTDFDREKFKRSSETAEAKRAAKEASNTNGTDDMLDDEDDNEQMKLDQLSSASKIKCIRFGEYEIDTWYTAPYPEEYSKNRVLYLCEFCLKYMNSEYVSVRHKLKCPAKHPPGDEIYRNDSISIFEVDGRKHPIYCQNLCLLAKLFLGSKTLYYDVEPFLFYVMTEADHRGCHFVGYFSKEKRSSAQNNVSCILTLPIHQRKGYGNLLIDFSYLLTRTEKKTGSPEKPLSDLGLVSYRNYWKLMLSYELRDQTTPLSIADISHRTGMCADDIVSAMEALDMLSRDPETDAYILRIDKQALEANIAKWEAKGYVKLNPEALVWTPFVHSPSVQTTAISTVAPRDSTAEASEDEGPEVSDTENIAESLRGGKDLSMLQNQLLSKDPSDSSSALITGAQALKENTESGWPRTALLVHSELTAHNDSGQVLAAGSEAVVDTTRDTRFNEGKGDLYLSNGDASEILTQIERFDNHNMDQQPTRSDVSYTSSVLSGPAADGQFSPDKPMTLFGEAEATNGVDVA
ncbi:hypothetical protein BJ508DRAFT_416006 [Ascobolus immersus RN42]|uniref:Histone acetyltransferase n=1 Tax=Ascobolus immersus RN42 TaxID=1160509 RepID=A0A3N4HZE7_ASCIM|nr:hypothetical protein BJ508DRAFT_416006 [Ascobolus immersus RN42]